MNRRCSSIYIDQITAYRDIAAAPKYASADAKSAYDELVSAAVDAWDELITPAVDAVYEHHDAVPEIPAVTHEELESAAYWVWHCDISKWIPAVYEDVIVVDVPEVPAWDEVITDVAAYDEEVVDEPAVPGHDDVFTKDFNTGTAAYNWIK